LVSEGHTLFLMNHVVSSLGDRGYWSQRDKHLSWIYVWKIVLILMAKAIFRPPIYKEGVGAEFHIPWVGAEIHYLNFLPLKSWA
jgi:hypothetical protein